MVSIWESKFVTASLQEDFQENFTQDDASPVVSFYKVKEDVHLPDVIRRMNICRSCWPNVARPAVSQSRCRVSPLAGTLCPAMTSEAASTWTRSS